MFLTIQMHLTCRKDRIHNRLQEKKNEDLFWRTSDDISRQIIIWWTQWHHWCRTFQPWRSNQEEMEDQFKKNDVYDAVSIREGKFIAPSCNRWKHRGIQDKICSTRLLTKRRHRIQRDICSQWNLKHINDELDEDLNLFYKVEDASLYTRYNISSIGSYLSLRYRMFQCIEYGRQREYDALLQREWL